MVLFTKLVMAVMTSTFISSSLFNVNDSNRNVRTTSTNRNVFLRIDDISDLHAGDKVIIANEFGGVLDHFGGNPTYVVARDYNGISGLGDKYVVTGSLSDYQILNVGKIGDYFTFQFTYLYSNYWDRVNCKNKYFCYRQSDGVYSGDKVNLYGDLYFTNDPNNANAQWKFIPSSYGDGFFNMQKSDEAHGTFITYENGYTRSRFWYGGQDAEGWVPNYGVRLYKYINLADYQNIFNFRNIHEPNRTTFYNGEDIDLTGLEFNLYLLDKDLVIDENTDLASAATYTLHSKYEHEKGYYSSITVEGSGNSTHAVFTYIGFGYRVFISIVQEQPEVNQYQLMDYSLLDYRGTYYFGFISNEHPMINEYEQDLDSYVILVLNGNSNRVGDMISSGPSMNNNTKIMDIPTSGSSTYIPQSKFEVKRVIVGGISKTYLYNPFNGYYLSYDDDNYLSYVEESALSDKEVFSISDNKPMLNGNKYIVFDYSSFLVSDSPNNPSKIFKWMPKSTFYTALDEFKTLFFNSIKCLSEGQIDFNANDWLNTKTSFMALSVDIQGYLANLIYVHNGEEAGSTADLVDRYDYIISKYPDDYDDYMNRKGAAYSNHFNNSQNSFVSPINQETSVLVIILIVTSLLTFIPIIYFVKRKRA